MLCDVWVMVFSSMVEWEGLDEEGDLGEKKMGFGPGVIWIPTLTRSFILSVKSRKWGNRESRLRGENERLDGVPVGESWECPGGAGGDSTCWAVGAGGDSSCWAVGAGGNSSCAGGDSTCWAVGAGGDSSCWVVGAGGDSSCWAVGAGGNSSCWGKDDDVKASLSVCCPSWSILISGGSNFSPEGCYLLFGIVSPLVLGRGCW